MNVISVTTMKVAAGGWDQTVGNHVKAKPILERHGAQNVRLLVPLAGGAESGTVHLVFEAADMASIGKVTDAIYSDPDMQTLMRSGADITTWTTSLLGEVPIS